MWQSVNAAAPTPSHDDFVSAVVDTAVDVAIDEALGELLR
jgi:hypothetical protein